MRKRALVVAERRDGVTKEVMHALIGGKQPTAKQMNQILCHELDTTIALSVNEMLMMRKTSDEG